jgi:hypothetical protein
MKPATQVEVIRLDAALAELLVHADFAADPGPGVELRGRLMGPRQGGVATIEVAYPLRPVAAVTPTRRSARVVIPDPNLWEPDTPFVYWGPAEVWAGGVRLAEVPIEVGLRRRPVTH